ncbi:MAG: phosphopantetheine-binding protein, partial [Planctomycetota bacterium]
MNQQEILEKLRPLIREVTRAPEEKMGMDSHIMDDLGADSLDLLDLSFLVEKSFGITMSGHDFERIASRYLPSGVFEENGILTDEAVAALRKVFPEVDGEVLAPGLRRLELPRLLTVGVFARLIELLLAEREGGGTRGNDEARMTNDEEEGGG